MFKKVFGIGAIMIVLLFGFYVGVTYLISKTVTDYTDSIVEKVGTEVVYLGDTLEIIDYSLLNETYTLQDGTKVNINYFNTDKNE